MMIMTAAKLLLALFPALCWANHHEIFSLGPHAGSLFGHLGGGPPSHQEQHEHPPMQQQQPPRMPMQQQQPPMQMHQQPQMPMQQQQPQMQMQQQQQPQMQMQQQQQPQMQMQQQQLQMQMQQQQHQMPMQQQQPQMPMQQQQPQMPMQQQQQPPMQMQQQPPLQMQMQQQQQQQQQLPQMQQQAPAVQQPTPVPQQAQTAQRQLPTPVGGDFRSSGLGCNADQRAVKTAAGRDFFLSWLLPDLKDVAKSWDDADAFCRGICLNLAQLSNMTVKKAVAEIGRESDIYGFWVGGRKFQGTWKWTKSGAKVNDSSWSFGGSLGLQQPDNMLGVAAAAADSMGSQDRQRRSVGGYYPANNQNPNNPGSNYFGGAGGYGGSGYPGNGNRQPQSNNYGPAGSSSNHGGPAYRPGPPQQPQFNAQGQGQGQMATQRWPPGPAGVAGSQGTMSPQPSSSASTTGSTSAGTGTNNNSSGGRPLAPQSTTEDCTAILNDWYDDGFEGLHDMDCNEELPFVCN